MMKTIICALVIAVFTGCASVSQPVELNGGYTLTGFDFRKYSDEGFLFSPYRPNDEYDSRGLITLTLTPQVKEVTRMTYAYKESMNYRETLKNEETGKMTTFTYEMVRLANGEKKYYMIQEIDPNDAIDEMYNRATSLGANALIDFSVEWNTINNFGLNHDYITVSGYAVHIKD